MIMLINHCWTDTTRLVIIRLGVGKRILGNMMINMMIGRPIMVGVANEANRFSFILFLKELGVLFFLLLLDMGLRMS